MEQSDLILHCLTEMLLKHFSRRRKQTSFVVIDTLRDIYVYYFIFVYLCSVDKKSLEVMILCTYYSRYWTQNDFRYFTRFQE